MAGIFYRSLVEAFVEDGIANGHCWWSGWHDKDVRKTLHQHFIAPLLQGVHSPSRAIPPPSGVKTERCKK